MKYRIPYLKILLVSLLIAGLSACELEETNINPNSPTEVPMSTLLPNAEERLATMMATTPQVMTGIFMQYYEGVDNHPLPVQSYIVNEALYVEWDWQTYYGQPMNSLYQIMQKAQEENAPYYTGIANTLMALSLGNMTSLWGDIPYSEAFLGSENRNPVFDSQESVYEEIQSLLDDAIVALDAAESNKVPAGDDIIYGGNLTLWKKAAYALKARYYLHLSKRAGSLGFDPATKALEAIQNAFSSDADDLFYQFGFNESEQNPFYGYCRLNYITPHTSFTGLLDNLNDPRKSHIFKVSFGQLGLLNAFYTSENSITPMMTYAELKFIEAEARLRINNNDPLIQSALNEAIASHMDIVSESGISNQQVTDYIAANATLTGNFNADLEKIITQKYISLFTGTESWVDYRRTGFPVLTPNTGGDHPQNPGGTIPRRFPYPQNERLYNSNFPSVNPTLQDRFWWDE